MSQQDAQAIEALTRKLDQYERDVHVLRRFFPDFQSGFNSILETLTAHGWSLCDDHWRTPDDQETEESEAVEWALRVQRAKEAL